MPLFINQSECPLFSSFFALNYPFFALNYLISASYFLKTAFLLADQNREIFVCILLMTKTAENHTLWGRTYLYSPYKGAPPGATGKHSREPAGSSTCVCSLACRQDIPLSQCINFLFTTVHICELIYNYCFVNSISLETYVRFLGGPQI